MLLTWLDNHGKWVDPRSVKDGLAAAESKLRKGKGLFSVTRDGRAVVRGKVRKEALTQLSNKIEKDKPGHVYRIRNGKGNIVHSMRTLKSAVDTSAKRRAMVRECRWGIGHQGPIHYAQTRPIPLAKFKNHTLPISTDCSGSTAGFAFAAGCPDPSGFHFNGQGSTDYIYKNSKQIDRRDVKPGDLAWWGIGSDGKHVAVVMQAGPDPLLCSHGMEAGPMAIRTSAEDQYHGGETLRWLRFIED